MDKKFKRKFKIYPWLSIDMQWPKSWGFTIIPAIQLDHWRYEEGGWWFTLQFEWLLFGITFDWRKESEGKEED